MHAVKLKMCAVPKRLALRCYVLPKQALLALRAAAVAAGHAH
jgi:hypothetical protein